MVERQTRLLFVEDDIGKRYVIARQLRAAGFHVDEAETGEQGLALITPDHDVAILDLRLPDMYGWDVCKRIKETPATSSVMVLELSATLATAQDRAKGLDLGADAYLVHPVELVELVATIRALTRLRHAVMERDQERELFIAAISHDLRNPLAAIANSMYHLQLSRSLTDKERQSVERIDRNVVRMKHLIDQLLVFTQGLASNFAIEPGTVDLIELCRNVLKDAERPADRAIALDAPAELRIAGDGERLGQLVENLVTNALRHGTSDVRLRLSADEESAVIEVHNHGTPIPADTIPRLFDPFKRSTRQSSGFGLGLFIAERIARAHRGSISVTSDDHEGTTFRVKLPLVSPT